jgi:hypothetical protein
MKKKKQNEATAPTQGPPKDFCDWWNPTGTDELTGAHIGGHPDAERVWSRPETGSRFTRRTFGVSAKVAWLDPLFRAEYNEWVFNGKPQRAKPFISMALTLAQQSAQWTKMKDVLAQIGKPMPRTTAKDVQAEARRMGLPQKTIEPLDESGDAIDF